MKSALEMHIDSQLRKDDRFDPDINNGKVHSKFMMCTVLAILADGDDLLCTLND